MDKIIVIAGGPWQKPFVSFLKSKGLYVCVVNPTCTETVAIADYHIKADVNDLDTINQHISHIKPIFITSDQSDISTMTVAKLSQEWKLPGNSPEVIERFSNKLVMAEFAKSLGIRTPITKIANSPKDITPPCIIKPINATNSRGFRKIDTDTNIFYETAKFGQVITQEYIPGDIQITIDGICANNKHKTLATSKKGRYFKPGLTSCVRYPSNLNLEEIIEQNDYYVEKSGLNFGLTHAEYIINNDFYLIEIAARGAGAGITDKITPWVSGINPYEILYKSLLGEIVDVKSLKPTQKPAVLQFYHEKEIHLTNSEEISKIPGVAMFQFDFRSKQFAVDPYNPRHSMGIYLANTEDELDQIIDKIWKLVDPSHTNKPL